jgi:uncharacterized damage-inducible protein DinB
MLTKDTAVMFARYSDWADQVLFKAIEQLPEGTVYKPCRRCSARCSAR